MSEIDLEAVRAAMFAHSGIRGIDQLRVYRSSGGDDGIAATLTFAAPDVDRAVVRATVRSALEEQFGIRAVDLRFNDPDPLPEPPSGGSVEKK